MNRTLILALLGAIAAPTAAYPETATAQVQDAFVSLPETVELAMVVAALKEHSKEGDRQTWAGGAYSDAVLEYFEPYAEMAAVSELPDGFNLPRLAGNAADFEFDTEGRLVEVDSSGSIWNDRDGDLFRRFRDELEAFAMASDFRAFYARHRDHYGELIDATTERIDPEDMRAWLEANFSARPGRARIFVSPLIGGLNWTTLYKPEQRIWVRAPRASDVAEASALDRMRAARSVFTEIDHGYVNPATESFQAEVAAAFGDTDIWATPRAAGSYPTAQLQFNEYLTWAVFLLYARDRLSPDDFEAIRPGVVWTMENGRGFVAFGAFLDQALALDERFDGSAEATIPELIAWSRARAASSG